METQKQIPANRRNAKKATAPGAPAGEALIRFNAPRHGLRATTASLPGEGLQELNQIRDRFMRCCRPQNRRTSPPGRSDSHQIGIFDRFSQRQARYERAFTKAYQDYEQSTRAQPQPPVRPARIEPHIWLCQFCKYQ